MKKLFSMVLCIIIALSLSACDFGEEIVDAAINKTATAKTFECKGLSMELTDEFLSMNFLDDTYDFIWSSGDLIVMGLHSKFEPEALQAMDADDYAEVFRENLSDSNPSEITHLDTIPTMEYTNIDEDGEQMKHFLAFYKAKDGIWIVMFSAEEDDYSEYYSDIRKYAKTVKCN